MSIMTPKLVGFSLFIVCNHVLPLIRPLEIRMNSNANQMTLMVTTMNMKTFDWTLSFSSSLMLMCGSFAHFLWRNRAKRTKRVNTMIVNVTPEASMSIASRKRLMVEVPFKIQSRFQRATLSGESHSSVLARLYHIKSKSQDIYYNKIWFWIV